MRSLVKKTDSGLLVTITQIVAIAMVLYHLSSGYVLLLSPIEHQNVHLVFALALVFLSDLVKSRRLWPLTLVFLLLSVASTGYVGLFFDELQWKVGDPVPSADVILVGGVLIILVIEGCRRSVGLVLFVAALIFLAYGFLGHYVPGYLHTFRSSPQEIISRLGIGSMGSMGIYSDFLSVSVNSIFLFIVFGSLLQVSGATRFFMQLAMLAGRRLAGGPAITAVISSALVGMVTGSVAANIATTGSFTIPMMKKTGYRPEQAGAIEATASTGGQIMPPIMGAAAFVMANFLGVPYAEVMKMAVIPAILYFFSAGLYAQFQAKKLRFAPLVEEVDTREMLLAAPLFIAPLTLMVVLLIQHYSLTYTMSLSVVLLLALSFVRKATRPNLRQLVNGFTQGARGGAEIGVICACLSVVTGVLEWKGLGLKLPMTVEMLSGGNLTLALVLAMIVSIILGMGIPTLGVYVLTAVAAAPALIRMGVTAAQAHFFAFYFGVLSFVTPPVAVGAVVAAKLAGAPYIKTAIEACKVAVGGFVVPFLIIWFPWLILKPEPGGTVLWNAVAMIACFTVIIALQAVICNYYLASLRSWERLLFSAISVTILVSLATKSSIMLLGALVFFILLTAWQWRKGEIKDRE